MNNYLFNAVKKSDIEQLITESSDKINYSDYSSALIMGIDDFYAKIRNDLEKILADVVYQIVKMYFSFDNDVSDNEQNNGEITEITDKSAMV